MIAKEKCTLPFSLWQAVSKRLYCRWPTGYQAQASDTTGPVTSYQLHSSHTSIMAWSPLQNIGGHTLVDRSTLRVSWLRLCTQSVVLRTRVTNILRKEMFQLLKKQLVVQHRPYKPFGYASGTSTPFPRMSMYGRASSLVRWLEGMAYFQGILALSMGPNASPGVKMGEKNLVEHPKWSRITSRKTCFRPIFDPFLTHCWSQNGPFARHSGIFHGPKCVTTGSKWAKNTCLSFPNGAGSLLKKCVFDPFLTHFGS